MNTGQRALNSAAAPSATIFERDRSQAPRARTWLDRFAPTPGRRILLGVAVVAAACQFVRPHPNTSPNPSGPNSLFGQHTPPPAVRQALENACYDCHSNRTNYPWYAQVQPAGWVLSSHVRRGKRALNLSEFGSLNPKTQARRLGYVVESMNTRDMPLPAYTKLHPAAVLTDAQIKEVTTWVESVEKQLERKTE